MDFWQENTYQGNFLFKFCHKFSFTPPLPGVFILKIVQFSPLNIFQSPPTPSMVRNNWGFYTSDSDTVNVNYDGHSYPTGYSPTGCPAKKFTSFQVTFYWNFEFEMKDYCISDELQ